MQRIAGFRLHMLVAAAIVLSTSGCTTPWDYVRNGFKVGPNCGVPEGDTASQWIDEADVRLRTDCAEVERWWTVFQDPTLDRLIADAYGQNLSLREAGFRILEARAQLGITRGNIFPQSQSMAGTYQRTAASGAANTAPGFGSQFADQWAFGFNLSWELDFWGRFRRAVTAAENTLDASCANYDQVLVTLLGDVASNYVQVRTAQHRIELIRSNVELQGRILKIADRRLKAGQKNALDARQAGSTLSQTEAQIPQLQITLRQACNRLCVLLGMPPTALEQQFGPGPIPTAPTSVAIGIPAELLRRRPDVRRAEREAAAQAEQIGIAEAALYPAFSINGTLAYQAENLPQLFNSDAIAGNVGPAFQWNLLNYGRIRNNMRAQDAKFWALVMVYQNTVLKANAEVEDGLAAFLRAQERAKLLDNSVAESRQAVEIVEKEYRVGSSDFNRVTLIEQNLVQQQDLQAQAYGDIALGLIQVYRGLGGGWQVPPTVSEATLTAPVPITGPAPTEPIPAPPSDAVNPPSQPIPPAPKQPTPKKAAPAASKQPAPAASKQPTAVAPKQPVSPALEQPISLAPEGRTLATKNRSALGAPALVAPVVSGKSAMSAMSQTIPDEIVAPEMNWLD